jgi:hypothetical protein
MVGCGLDGMLDLVRSDGLKVMQACTVRFLPSGTVRAAFPLHVCGERRQHGGRKEEGGNEMMGLEVRNVECGSGGGM